MRSRWFVSVRWWLALAFAAIAAITALAVAQVSRSQAEQALRDKAQELAAGTAVSAAARISADATSADLATVTAHEARRRNVALFLFDSSGSLVSPSRSLRFDVAAIPNLPELLEHALRGERLVTSIDDGRRITVALPIRADGAAALVEVASRPDLVAAVDIVRDTILVAAAWATLIGVVVGTLVSLLITARVRRIAAAATAIEQGQFDVELRPRFPDELGKLGQAVDSMRRNLRASFERLGGERDRLRMLIEQLQEGVIAVDAELHVVVANGRASELLGTTVRPGKRLPEPWAALSLAQFARQHFLPAAEEETVRIAPSEDRVFLVSGLPAGAGVDAVVLVIRDVTEHERRERAEREFVANAAHELRTPLTAIASAVEVLKESAKDDPGERDRFLDAIERQTARLSRLVRALLTLARAQTNAGALRLEPVALEPLLREIADDAGLPPSSVSVDEDASVLAHPDLIRQAVENLVANAQKHAGSEGLTVLGRRAEDHLAVIEVRDSGPGMSRQEADRIADRFFRVGDRDADGFGLGLSIAREVTHALGGELEIETQPSVGTTVRLRLRTPEEN
jgi:two-component system, OmpR family, sensor histidine kinase VicK